MYKTNILSAISVIGILCIAILLHIYRRRIWGIDKEEFFGGDVVEHLREKEKVIDKDTTIGELIDKDTKVSEFIKKIVPNLHDEFFKRGDIEKIQGELTTNKPEDIKGYVQKMLQGCKTAPGPQGIPGPRGPRGADGGKYKYTGYIENNKGEILQYDSKSQKSVTVTFVKKDKNCENCIWSIDEDGLINLYAKERVYLKNSNGNFVVGGNPRDENNNINKGYNWKIVKEGIQSVNGKKNVNDEKIIIKAKFT